MLWSALWIEALRARPRAAVLLAATVYAAVWLLLPLLFYASPPEALASYLVGAREWQVLAGSGGPLAAWLSALALRAAGLAGYYALCAVAAVLAVALAGQLARSLLGPSLGGAAALLFLAGLAMGGAPAFLAPDRLVLPVLLWLVWESWRYVGEGRPGAASRVAGAGGLALFAGWAGWIVLAATLFLLVRTREGRRALRRTDPVRPLVVAMTFLAPFAFWAGFHAWVLVPAAFEPDIPALARFAGESAAALLAILLLWLVAGPLGDGARAGEVPQLRRPPLPPLALRFLAAFIGVPALFALPPVVLGVVLALSGVLLAALAIRLVAQRGAHADLHRRRAVALLWLLALFAPPLAAAGSVVIAPYAFAKGEDVNFPARAIARPIAEIVERRTGRPPGVIAGESFLAAALALAAPGAPAVMPEADPARAPWLRQARRPGAVVAVWRVDGPGGEPPPAIRSRWPGLTPEAPIVVPWAVAGRLEPVRVGWAVVPPAQ